MSCNIGQENAWVEVLLPCRRLSDRQNNIRHSKSLQMQQRSELPPERHPPASLQKKGLQEGSASM